MSGHLIAFEGLDQSGKQTQAERLRDRLKQDGRKARLVSFPDYATSIGEEIARALQGEREYGPDVMQLLYVANRYERKPDLLRWLEGGLMLVSDRYTASSIAYGEAFGLDPAWLADLQKFLPPAWLTIFLDIAPETATAAEGRRSRPVRTGPRAAESRSRELPAPGGRAGLGGGRRRAIQGRHRRGRLQRGGLTTRATVAARTSRTPMAISARAHASSVAPVVLTSSTSTTTAPWSGGMPGGVRLRGANAPRTLRWRCAAGRPVCVGVARTRRSAAHTGGPPAPSRRARSSAWLKPRARRRDAWSGTGTRQSAPASTAPHRVRISAASGPASDRRPSYFSACTIARSAPS